MRISFPFGKSAILLSSHLRPCATKLFTREYDNRTRKQFRFEKMWLRAEDIGNTIGRSWSAPTGALNAANNFVRKLRKLRKVLIKWERNSFGNA